MATDRDADRAHYFAAEPHADSDPLEVEVVLPDAAFRLRTDRGVFSHGQLDRGSALLLRHEHPLPRTGNLLDLGCGAGPIAMTMAQRSPHATVWAIDVNTRALALCNANASRAGLSNIVVAAPDEVPHGTTFAALWSNPPIRIGKAALHDLLATWLPRLDEGGEALLVVQKHLGADSLAHWLRVEGWHVDRLTSKSGFRLLAVTRESCNTSR